MEIKINLVPPYIKKEMDRTRRLDFVLGLGGGALVIFAVFFLILFGVYKILELNLSAVSQLQKNGGDSKQYARVKELDEEFEKINRQMKEILSIKKDQLYWSNIFFELSSSSISGIVLESLKSDNYSLAVSGKAVDRDTLIAYKEKLESNQCFSDIHLPLSNLVSRSDINFQIDFKVKEECLKKNK